MRMSKFKESWREARENLKSKRGKVDFTVYVVLRTLVTVVLIEQLVLKNYSNVFTCLLTLVLFMIPVFVEDRLKIELPSLLEVIILLFIFSAEILGEINRFYILIPYWDTVLHTINGFIMAAIGFAMIDILNNSHKFHFDMSPIFVVLVAFCFSMTTGVVWEFFEYGMDRLTLTDMQKDDLLKTVSTVYLNPDNENKAVIIKNITETTIEGTVNGEPQTVVVEGGYIDVGLTDTIEDLFVNCIGGCVFSVFGYIYIKNRGKKGGELIQKLIPVRKGAGDVKELPPTLSTEEDEEKT